VLLPDLVPCSSNEMIFCFSNNCTLPITLWGFSLLRTGISYRNLPCNLPTIPSGVFRCSLEAQIIPISIRRGFLLLKSPKIFSRSIEILRGALHSRRTCLRTFKVLPSCVNYEVVGKGRKFLY